jgi:N-acetylmuramoyl-L-alanine amidase
MIKQDSHAEGLGGALTAVGGVLRSVARRVSARALGTPAGVVAVASLAVGLAVVATAVISPSSQPSSRTAARLRSTPIVAQATPAGEEVRPVGRGGPIPFQRDACLGYAPTGRPNGVTVALDPGHGGVDPGAIAVLGGRKVSEKQATLAVGLRALALLRAAGYRVVISRVGDSTVARFGAGDLHQGILTPDAAQREIEARNLCANAARARALIAIHMNAFADPSALGTETVYCPSRPFAARSRRLAELVQKATLQALRGSGMATLDRGVLPDRAAGGAALTPQTADYHHLIELGPADRPWLPYPSRMPAVLVEPVFLTNPAEASFVLGRRGQNALARALLAALDAYFARRSEA